MKQNSNRGDRVLLEIASFIFIKRIFCQIIDAKVDVSYVYCLQSFKF